MRFAFWITKATDTHSEYLTLIALSRQQWLRERSSMSRRKLPVFLMKPTTALTTIQQYKCNIITHDSSVLLSGALRQKGLKTNVRKGRPWCTSNLATKNFPPTTSIINIEE
jgi:hypothetical protein